MKEVLELYLTACNRAMIARNKISFDFGNIHIDFSFTPTPDTDNEYFSFQLVDNISDINELVEKVRHFNGLIIKGESEGLEWREDISAVTEVKSITNEMFALIKVINSFQRSAILNYNTNIKYSDPMCGDYSYYSYNIEIAESFWWNIEFAKHLIETKANNVKIPEFYTIFFRKNQPIKDDKNLPILSTNTKVRRLGYFKILSLFLDENKQIPSSTINKIFERFCLKYKDILDKSEYNKGLIKETKNGISAKPYIEIATDIELLNKINNVIYVGKSMKVYQALKNDYNTSSNIFELNTFDKMYFLECILRYDYFYFSNLLEFIYIQGGVSYSKMVSGFQSKLINSLEEYKKQNQYTLQRYKSPTYNTDRKVVSKLDNILNRIRKWEKAEVYLEHLIMPRLNWMLDFGIASYDNRNNEYILEKTGQELFKHLCIWNDINIEKIISPSKFLDNFMIHLFDDCFNNNIVSNPDDIKLILNRIYTHIEKSFEIFKTLAPNRVTASQAASYTKYKLYMDDKIKVDYSFILNKMSEKEQDKFVFKYQEQYQDGYIQIKR